MPPPRGRRYNKDDDDDDDCLSYHFNSRIRTKVLFKVIYGHVTNNKYLGEIGKTKE